MDVYGLLVLKTLDVHLCNLFHQKKRPINTCFTFSWFYTVISSIFAVTVKHCFNNIVFMYLFCVNPYATAINVYSYIRVLWMNLCIKCMWVS